MENSRENSNNPPRHNTFSLSSFQVDPKLPVAVTPSPARRVRFNVPPATNATPAPPATPAPSAVIKPKNIMFSTPFKDLGKSSSSRSPFGLPPSPAKSPAFDPRNQNTSPQTSKMPRFESMPTGSGDAPTKRPRSHYNAAGLAGELQRLLMRDEGDANMKRHLLNSDNAPVPREALESLIKVNSLRSEDGASVITVPCLAVTVDSITPGCWSMVKCSATIRDLCSGRTAPASSQVMVTRASGCQCTLLSRHPLTEGETYIIMSASCMRSSNDAPMIIMLSSPPLPVSNRSYWFKPCNVSFGVCQCEGSHIITQ